MHSTTLLVFASLFLLQISAETALTTFFHPNNQEQSPIQNKVKNAVVYIVDYEYVNAAEISSGTLCESVIWSNTGKGALIKVDMWVFYKDTPKVRNVIEDWEKNRNSRRCFENVFFRSLDPELKKNELNPSLFTPQNARLAIGSLLPVHYQKALYMDADTIVDMNVFRAFRHSSSRALGIVISNMAPTVEDVLLKKNIQTLNGKLPQWFQRVNVNDKLPNSGVFIANLTSWRRLKTTRKASRYLKDNQNTPLFRLKDQVILHLLFKSDHRTSEKLVFELPGKWNICGLGFAWNHMSEQELEDKFGINVSDTTNYTVRRKEGIYHWSGPMKYWKPNGANRHLSSYFISLLIQQMKDVDQALATIADKAF